jgi:ubiquinone biosynthesis protein
VYCRSKRFTPLESRAIKNCFGKVNSGYFITFGQTNNIVSKPASESNTSLLGRYEQVISVLFKYGFEDVMSHPPFNRFAIANPSWVPIRDGKSVMEFTRYERIRMVCEELGTTFIKFAQIAANRPDILPDELIRELEQFHDHAPVVPSEDVLQIIENEFGKPVGELFEAFEEIPVASASMAQVHKAVLHGGKFVALKIQRPGIRQTVEQDIRILYNLAEMIESYFPDYSVFQPKELVKMFEDSIRKELRFTLEAGNLLRFQENFKNEPGILVPQIYKEFCTDHVLCMEYIDGIKLTDLDRLAKYGIKGPEIAIKGINLYYQQVFEFGFFHADPHPGNIFVLPDGRICFIDYGMMGFVLDSDKELMANLLLSIAERDVAGLKKALAKFSSNEQLLQSKDLEYDIVDFLATYSTITLQDIDGQEVMQGLQRMMFKYKIRIPQNLLLLLKALIIIEGVGLVLDPNYNIIKNIEPFVRRLLEQKYQPKKLAHNLVKAAADMTKMALNLPDDLSAIIRKVRQGKLHIEFEHKGLEKLYQKMEVVSNRIAFTLLLTALIIGSSLIIIADIPPHIYNIPALGFFGFIISGLLAFRLIFSIIKHGNF